MREKIHSHAQQAPNNELKKLEVNVREQMSSKLK